VPPLFLAHCISAAPEIISARGHYDGKTADIWSSGVMLYVMLFCEYPFERPEDEADKYGFQKVTPPPSPLALSAALGRSLQVWLSEGDHLVCPPH